MTFDIQELGCSVERDPRTGDPSVVLTFEEKSDEFSLALRPKEALALADLLRDLAAEAEKQKAPTGNS